MSDHIPKGNVRASTVQQHHAAAQDINAIMARHLKSGTRGPVGNPAATAMPRFDNLSSMSYHEMLNFVTDNRSRFMSLPAKLRRRFNHDPYQMLRFLEIPENRLEGVRLGLLTPTEEEFQQIELDSAVSRAAAIQRAQEALGQLNLAPAPQSPPPPLKASSPSGGLPQGDK